MKVGRDTAEFQEFLVDVANTNTKEEEEEEAEIVAGVSFVTRSCSDGLESQSKSKHQEEEKQNKLIVRRRRKRRRFFETELIKTP